MSYNSDTNTNSKKRKYNWDASAANAARTGGQHWGGQDFEGGVRPFNPKAGTWTPIPTAPSMPRLFVPRTPGGQIVAEKKYFDSSSFRTIVDADINFANQVLDPLTLNCLFAPTKGNSIENREANAVHVHTIKLRGNILRSSTVDGNQDQPMLIRIILVQDKQTNGTQMVSENLIQSGVVGPVPPAIFMFQNTGSFGRYQILKEKFLYHQTVPLVRDQTTGNLINSIQQMFFKMSYKFSSPLKVQFNSSNSGTVADIVDHSFHLIVACTPQGPTSPGQGTPTMNMRCRVSFTG